MTKGTRFVVTALAALTFIIVALAAAVPKMISQSVCLLSIQGSATTEIDCNDIQDH